jgi:hypothetical protein
MFTPCCCSIWRRICPRFCETIKGFRRFNHDFARNSSIFRFKAKEFLDIHSLEELRQYLDEQGVAKNSLVFIDSLQLLIERFSLPSTSWLLNQLSELSACVLALVDDDVIGEENGGEEWRRLESVSHTLFQLELAEEEDERGEPIVLCRTMARKRDESFETKVSPFLGVLEMEMGWKRR